MKSEDILNEVYKIRMIVLLETNPQSNKYHQIMLDKKQFGSVSKVIADSFPKEEGHKCDNPHCAGVEIKYSDKEVVLPDNIQDIHYCKGECTC